jgi:hypothetical protein
LYRVDLFKAIGGDWEEKSDARDVASVPDLCSSVSQRSTQDRRYAALGLTSFGGSFVLIRVLFGRLPDRVAGLPVAIGSLVIETLVQFRGLPSVINR